MFKTVTFLSEWKVVRIAPIPKTDCLNTCIPLVINYEISIPSVVSKVLERPVKELIDNYVADNSPMSNINEFS